MHTLCRGRRPRRPAAPSGAECRLNDRSVVPLAQLIPLAKACYLVLPSATYFSRQRKVGKSCLSVLSKPVPRHESPLRLRLVPVIARYPPGRTPVRAARHRVARVPLSILAFGRVRDSLLVCVTHPVGARSARPLRFSYTLCRGAPVWAPAAPVLKSCHCETVPQHCCGNLRHNFLSPATQ